MIQDVKTIIETNAVVKEMSGLKEVFWINPCRISYEDAKQNSVLSMDDIIDASERLNRFAPYIMKAFRETETTCGIIESELVEIFHMKEFLENENQITLQGKLYMKMDSQLPISGSVKARGGIYEVLTYAEDIAFSHNMLTKEDDYTILSSSAFYQLFQQYELAVGSTGNLGLSIGIMGAKLGFKTTVHMSHDAKQWKKDLLRNIGVTVVEYEEDYSNAVAQGRKQALSQSNCHFIDDENSTTLFLGYAVAALRLKKQLDKMKISVDLEHPLYVYLPCGVGGGPGGIAFGLKMVFGNHVHCFFAEPTHSPSMLLGLTTKLYDKICVQDIGIDNVTDADGLAVGRASSFVGQIIEPFLNGSYTISDETMYKYLYYLKQFEGIELEPSALAGMQGPVLVEGTNIGREYLEANRLDKFIDQSTHIVWATGGNMVPEDMRCYYQSKYVR